MPSHRAATMHVKQFAELRRADGAPAISLSTALQTTGDTAGTALLAGSGVGTAIAGRVLRLREGCRLARGREGSVGRRGGGAPTRGEPRAARAAGAQSRGH